VPSELACQEDIAIGLLRKLGYRIMP
jgi:hypothetical protein